MSRIFPGFKFLLDRLPVFGGPVG